MEQRTAEWYLARKGRFTASEIYNLLTTSRKKDEIFGDTALSYIKEKVAEYVMNDDIFVEMTNLGFSNMATRWGERYEAEARELYSGVTGMPVEETGFIAYSRHSGGSPDGLCADGEGLIEIKCPFTPSRHVEFMMTRTADDLLAVNKQYYWQCQANLLFTGRGYIDFVSYDPRMSDLLRMRILRVEADTKAHELIRSRLSLAEERLENMVSEITRIGIEQYKAINEVA